MRRPIIAGNWKMYKTITEAIDLANGLKRELFKINAQNLGIVICPPYTALSEVAEVIYESNIKLGAQDAHWQPEGAFTGEVSVKMLKDAGVEFIIIGHSERRQYFNETNETVNKKVKAVLKEGLKPIMCVGETLAEREAGQTLAVVKAHVEKGLGGIDAQQAAEIVLAYEPVWAIGTGRTATPAQVQEVQKYIRDLLTKMYNKEVASAMIIQYGGSVKLENISELMQQPDIDGALVGGASLDLKSFSEIVKIAYEVKK
jgi:triosephosphate isomerase